MKRTYLLAAVAISMSAFVCDIENYPGIRNGLDRTARIEVIYSSGEHDTVYLEPGASLWAPREGVFVKHLRVESGGRVVSQLDDTAIQRALDQVGEKTVAVWNVTEDGVTPLTRRELQSVSK